MKETAAPGQDVATSRPRGAFAMLYLVLLLPQLRHLSLHVELHPVVLEHLWGQQAHHSPTLSHPCALAPSELPSLPSSPPMQTQVRPFHSKQPPEGKVQPSLPQVYYCRAPSHLNQ